MMNLTIAVFVALLVVDPRMVHMLKWGKVKMTRRIRVSEIPIQAQAAPARCR